MRRLLAFVCLVVVLPLSSGAQQQARPASVKTTAQSQTSAPESPAPDLPVRRVVLYKNGVGYFEHIGRVRGNEDIHIDFTSGQLNDALASLTVLDLDGGRISGVSYNSAEPFDRRLGALRLPLDEQTSVAKFLDALRGSRLEVSSGDEAVSGRLLSVERKTRTAGGTTLEVDIISVVTDSGEIRERRMPDNLRPSGRPRNGLAKWTRYLSLLGFRTRAGCAPDDRGYHRRGRAPTLCQLHQRSAGLENYLSTGALKRVGEEAAAARLGDCGQHGGRGLEQCESWSPVCRCAAIVHPGSSRPYYGRRAKVPLSQEQEAARRRPTKRGCWAERKSREVCRINPGELFRRLECASSI